jgi:uncharacterized membrane protein YgaE (UPF0421/DUF939 family)
VVIFLTAAAVTGGGGGISPVSTYGPIVVATAGLITALVAALGRRDKKTSDITNNLDARTQTALKGLQAYSERAELERARWQEHAEKETLRADAAEAKVEELERELARVHRPPSTRRQTGK